MTNIDTLKGKLKALAREIQIAKPQRKTHHFTGERTISPSKARTLCIRNKYQFRHMHIAYCELRGKTREQIEPHVRKGNEPNEMYIQKIKAEYAFPVIEVAV